MSRNLWYDRWNVASPGVHMISVLQELQCDCATTFRWRRLLQMLLMKKINKFIMSWAVDTLNFYFLLRSRCSDCVSWCWDYSAVETTSVWPWPATCTAMCVFRGGVGGGQVCEETSHSQTSFKVVLVLVQVAVRTGDLEEVSLSQTQIIWDVLAQWAQRVVVPERTGGEQVHHPEHKPFAVLENNQCSMILIKDELNTLLNIFWSNPEVNVLQENQAIQVYRNTCDCSWLVPGR